MNFKKPAYICGPLTELSREEQVEVKRFYESIGDLFQEITGVRAFVPHEKYDPIKFPNFSPAEIDKVERVQVCKKTSVLIVIAIAPSWGGGIEVEMANRSGVPVWILCEQKKLQERGISRLLRGNPAVAEIIPYASREEATGKLRSMLIHLVFNGRERSS